MNEKITIKTLDEQPLLTPADLAKRLSVSVGTIRGWRFYGKGPKYIKVGNAYRYSILDVDAWLEEQNGEK
jgi:hypothetical protein